MLACQMLEQGLCLKSKVRRFNLQRGLKREEKKGRQRNISEHMQTDGCSRSHSHLTNVDNSDREMSPQSLLQLAGTEA